MHAAPAVRVELGRSAGWIAFVSLLAAATVALWVAWWLTVTWSPGAAAGVSGAAAAVAAAVAARMAWRAQSPGVLAWDGSGWHWADRPGDVTIRIDLGGWILLYFRPDTPGSARWIAASRHAARGPWAALRAALYSPRPAETLDAPPA